MSRILTVAVPPNLYALIVVRIQSMRMESNKAKVIPMAMIANAILQVELASLSGVSRWTLTNLILKPRLFIGLAKD